MAKNRGKSKNQKVSGEDTVKKNKKESKNLTGPNGDESGPQKHTRNRYRSQFDIFGLTFFLMINFLVQKK